MARRVRKKANIAQHLDPLVQRAETDLWCKPGRAVQPVRLAWDADDAAQATTTLRVLPALDPESEQRQFDRFWDPETQLYSEFLMPAIVWWRSGSPPVTFIAQSDELGDFGPEDSPAIVLWNALLNLARANKLPTEWAFLLPAHHLPTGWRDDLGRHRPLIRYVGKSGFVQALVLENGRKLYKPPLGYMAQSRLPVVDLGPRATQLLYAAVREIKPGAEDEIDPQKRFRFGDPITLDSPTAAFLRFTCSERGFAEDRNPKTAGRPVRIYDPGQEHGFSAGWLLGFVDAFNGMLARVTSKESQQRYLQRVQYWDDVLEVLPPEKQAEVISGCVPPEVLEAVWEDRPEWQSHIMHVGGPGLQVPAAIAAPYPGTIVPGRERLPGDLEELTIEEISSGGEPVPDPDTLAAVEQQIQRAAQEAAKSHSEATSAAPAAPAAPAKPSGEDLDQMQEMFDEATAEIAEPLSPTGPATDEELDEL